MTTYNQTIRAILAKVLQMEQDILDTIDEDADLTEQHLSSVLVVELVVELEMHYGIMIDDDDLLTENVATIRKIRELIEKYHAIQPSAG